MPRGSASHLDAPRVSARNWMGKNASTDAHANKTVNTIRNDDDGLILNLVKL